MLILGIGFLVLITGLKTILTPFWFGLSQLLQAPSRDYIYVEKPKKVRIQNKLGGSVGIHISGIGFSLAIPKFDIFLFDILKHMFYTIV